MRTIRLVAIVLGASIVPSFAFAGDKVSTETIANDGIAFSRFEKIKSEKKGVPDKKGPLVAYDVVAAYDNNKIVAADCAAYSAQYKGVTWCFATRANKEAFVKKTDKKGRNAYEPFAGGRCTLGLAFGNLTARGDPRTAILVGKRLVLNGSLKVRARFLSDTARHMDNARISYRIGKSLRQIRPNSKLVSKKQSNTQ